eukprot:TRINITY_DN16576_c1_g2_i1.p1 TRINITY_DN16576_c1_g2~~TRINITY_DN16576_c1_g2_i1.p1  ORF type:complete len:499 (-),score=67.15 TRINITY_DN16576_c1_g2_i1:260-1660(-)
MAADRYNNNTRISQTYDQEQYSQRFLQSNETQQAGDAIVDRLRSQVQELQTQNNDLNRRLRMSTQRCEQLQQQSVEVELREQMLQDEIKRNRAEIRNLQNHLEDAKQRLNTMEDGRRAWEEQSRHQSNRADEISREILMWKDRALKAERQVEEDKKKIDVAVGNQNRMEDDLLQYKKKNNDLQSQLNRFERDNESLRQNQMDAEDKFDEFSAHIVRLQKQLEQMEMENEALRRNQSILEKERDGYYDTALELRDEIEREQQRYNRLKEELSSFKILKERVEQARTSSRLYNHQDNYVQEDVQPFLRPPARSRSPGNLKENRTRSPRNQIMSARTQRSLSPRTREKFKDDQDVNYKQHSNVQFIKNQRQFSPYAEDREVDFYNPMECTPYGNAATLQVMMKESKELEDQLLQLNMEKADLENEYSKMPVQGCKTVKMKTRKVEVEQMLDSLDKTISKVKRELRNRRN